YREGLLRQEGRQTDSSGNHYSRRAFRQPHEQHCRGRAGRSPQGDRPGSLGRRGRERPMKDGAQGGRDYDWWLIAILMAICALGVLEIYSATHASGGLAGMHYKQIRWLVFGFILMFVLSRLDYHLILDQAPVLYVICLVALGAVLVLGNSRFGA